MPRVGTLSSLLTALAAALTLTLSGCDADAVGSRGSAVIRRLTVKMLDIGQGDAALIRTGEQTILIDTGDVTSSEKLAESLSSEGVTAIDKLIITHPHRDHLGGAGTVLKKFTVRAAYDNGQPATPRFYREYLRTIRDRRIPYRTLSDGDRLDFGDGAEFHVLSPASDMVERSGKSSLNENSIEGRLTYGKFSMLFTGDGTGYTEKGIMRRHQPGELASTVLKAPHHGSKTSSVPAFLRAVSPRLALISCGAGNDYHCPHPSVRARYRKAGIDWYRTDRNGTITVVTDGETYDVSCERGEKNDDSDN